MICLFPVVHTVILGDTIEGLATIYHTSVNDIIANNPGIMPRFLNPGMRLMICPGREFFIRTQFPLQNIPWWLWQAIQSRPPQNQPQPPQPPRPPQQPARPPQGVMPTFPTNPR